MVWLCVRDLGRRMILKNGEKDVQRIGIVTEVVKVHWQKIIFFRSRQQDL